MDLSRLLAPASVAVVGANDRPGSYGSEALLNLERIGFAGRAYGVHPTRTAAHGIACAPSLADLPEAPDAVVVAIPAAGVPAVVAEAGALGCGGAVVFAAGFAESSEPSGAALQEALRAAAAVHDLPVCGPNGNGLVAPARRVALWGDMVSPQPAGPVALVTQSGNVAVNALASRRGLSLHTVVSCGNQAVVSAEDWVAALAVSEGVRSIGLYLEADGDGAAWCDALEACARADVAVAVLKAGTSAAGAAAAQAHTGALAGDQRAFRAVVEACGAAWATDPHELLELAKALAVRGPRRTGGGGLAPGDAAGRSAPVPPAPDAAASPRRPGRPALAVMTCSGGDSSVAADLAEELGLALPAPAPATVAALERLLPEAATAQNPLDYTSLLWEDPEALAGLVVALADDPAVEQLLVLYDQPAGLGGAAAASWAAVLDAVVAGAGRAAAPVAVASTLPELLDDEAARGLLRRGLPAVAGLRTGLRCAAALTAPRPDPERIAAIGAAARARVPPGRDGDPAGGWLAEHEAKALLRAAGIAVPDGGVAEDAEDAVAAFTALGGGPVALKLSGPDLRHKSELGALRLGLGDADAVAAAAEGLLALDAAAGCVLLVEAMAPPGAELLVAVRADGVAPVLVVGLGGVWAEALDDVAVLALPADAAAVERALRGLHGAALLTGGRGRSPLDVAAAARLAAAAGALALRERLALLELNPVIVHAAGATAADALALDAVARPAPPVPALAGAVPTHAPGGTP